MAEFIILNMILFLISAQFVVDVYLLCCKCCTQVIHANGAHHFQCDVKVLIQELYCFDTNITLIMISGNGTMSIFVSYSIAYVLY